MGNDRRIAKNTLLLYIRMFISMIVGLYTSRVVLNVLGVEDYGIYGVVGGVVAMMGFLNATMSGATARFITYEIGRGEKEMLSKTFSSAFVVHIIIAAVVLIVGETLGVWFLNNKMVIPENRIIAANWVLHFSLLSSVVTIIQVPFNACIIAHERMNVYAYIEIMNVILKLLVVFLLLTVSFDKLISYAALFFVVTLFVAALYASYCYRRYEESRIKLKWDSKVIRPMVSFSGWDLYGNFSGTARQYGVNIIINMFFGPLLNAASSIATSVVGMVSQFTANVVMAIKPQIIKSYAQGNYQESARLISLGCLVNFLLMSFICIPLISEMHYVLVLWLKTVPEYAVEFCQLSLVTALFSSQSLVLMTGIHASGKIKGISFILGTIYLLVIPITYLSFRYGMTVPWLPYIVNVIAALCGVCFNAIYVHRYITKFSLRTFFCQLFFKYLMPFLIILFAVSYVKTNFDESFFRLIVSFLTSIILIVAISYIWIIPAFVRSQLIGYAKSLCKKT